jgi:hypothetical protein
LHVAKLAADVALVDWIEMSPPQGPLLKGKIRCVPKKMTTFLADLGANIIGVHVYLHCILGYQNILALVILFHTLTFYLKILTSKAKTISDFTQDPHI